MVNGNTASSSSINLNKSSNTYENLLPEAANIITVPNEAKFDRVMEQHFRYVLGSADYLQPKTFGNDFFQGKLLGLTMYSLLKSTQEFTLRSIWY